MSPLHRVPRLAPTVFLACGLLATPFSLEAQGAPPPGGEEHGMRTPGRGRGFDPVVMAGPPGPEEMTTLVALTEGQQSHYATLYQNLMAETKSERDSLAALRAARRDEQGREGRGAGGARPMMGGMAEIRSDLEQKQRGFDAALKDFLTRDQWKRYGAWLDQRRSEARERMRGMRGAPSGRDSIGQSP